MHPCGKQQNKAVNAKEQKEQRCKSDEAGSFPLTKQRLCLTWSENQGRCVPLLLLDPKEMGPWWHDLCGQSLGAGRFACIWRFGARLDAIRLFIVGWVGGDSGRHSPSRLYRPQCVLSFWNPPGASAKSPVLPRADQLMLPARGRKVAEVPI